MINSRRRAHGEPDHRQVRHEVLRLVRVGAG
jgi:hypothetical protein